MRFHIPVFLLAVFFALAVTGCTISKTDNDDSGRENNGDSEKNKSALDWDAVPSQYNPSIEEQTVSVANVKRVEINYFGFSDDVRLKYDDSVTLDQGLLKIYKVMRGVATWGEAQEEVENDTLEIFRLGQYQCSIRIENGKITDLDGGCYVRIELVLNPAQKVEVYAPDDRRLSKRFFAMTTTQLVDKLDDAVYSEEKFDAIDDFLNSYKETSQTPKFQAEDLRLMLDEFTYDDDKLDALRRLHSYVTDRNNLRSVIEDQFSTFEQEEALDICGL